jgi:DNA-binding transcriptional LysR family regulator
MSQPLKPRQLQCFVAVAETLNFRQAAERLFMTQPPLSRQIQALETQLGVRLFDRDTRGVRLTVAGEQFLPDARRLLEVSAATLEKYRGLARADGGSLRLGLTRVVEPGALQVLLAELTARSPDAALSWQADTSQHLIRAVARGDLDAAFIGQPADIGDLGLAPWRADPLMVALPSAHPLASRRQLALADLNPYGVFWFRRARNPGYFDRSRQVFAAAGFAPRWLDEPDDHHVLLGQVAAGDGLALIAHSLGTLRRRGVVYRALREGGQLAIELSLVFRPTAVPPLLETLLLIVREQAEGLGRTEKSPHRSVRADKT